MIIEDDMHYIIEHCGEELRALQGKTLMITGASGFIGGYIMRAIAEYNRTAKERITLLLPTRLIGLHQNEGSWFTWDGRSDLNTDTPCDYIIHAAGPRASDTAHLDDIVRTTNEVLIYARKQQVERMLFLSSWAVLDNPITQYGLAKKAAEHLCCMSEADCMIARIFSIIGPTSPEGYAASDFIKSAVEQGAINVKEGTAERSYYYIADLVCVLLKLLLSEKKSSVYNVKGGKIISINELARIVALYAPTVVLHDAMSIEESVRRTVEWAKEVRHG